MSIDSNALIEEFLCSQNDFISPLYVNISTTNCFHDNLSDDDPAFNLCSQCKYYDVDKLKRESCLVTNLACVHINARSVAENFSSVTEMCEVVNYAFDFIIITEAWIDEYCADFFSLPGYLSFSFPRLSKKGGGIMIFVMSCYVFSVFDVDVNVSCFESGVVKAVNVLTGEHFTLCGIYKPPNTNTSEFFDDSGTFL